MQVGSRLLLYFEYPKVSAPPPKIRRVTERHRTTETSTRRHEINPYANLTKYTAATTAKAAPMNKIGGGPPVAAATNISSCLSKIVSAGCVQSQTFAATALPGLYDLSRQRRTRSFSKRPPRRRRSRRPRRALNSPRGAELPQQLVRQPGQFLNAVGDASSRTPAPRSRIPSKVYLPRRRPRTKL